MKRCLRCRGKNPGGLRFCNHCGARMVERAALEGPEGEAVFLEVVPPNPPPVEEGALGRAQAVASRLAGRAQGLARRAARALGRPADLPFETQYPASAQGGPGAGSSRHPDAPARASSRQTETGVTLEALPGRRPRAKGPAAPRAGAAQGPAPVGASLATTRRAPASPQVVGSLALSPPTVASAAPRAAAPQAAVAPAAAPASGVDLARAHALYLEGRKAYDAGDRAGAARAFTQAARLAPADSPMGSFLRRVLKPKAKAKVGQAAGPASSATPRRAAPVAQPSPPPARPPVVGLVQPEAEPEPTSTPGSRRRGRETFLAALAPEGPRRPSTMLDEARPGHGAELVVAAAGFLAAASFLALLLV